MFVTQQKASELPKQEVFVGSGQFQFIAINPTVEEMIELGIPHKKDKVPNYYDEINDVAYTVFYFHNPLTGFIRYQISCSDEDVLSSKGNYKYITGYASTNGIYMIETFYSPSIEEYYERMNNFDWYSNPVSEYTRVAKRGEEEFTNVILSIVGHKLKTKKDDEVSHYPFLLPADIWQKVLKGDFEWLKFQLKDIKDKTIIFNVYATESNGNIYPTVYNKRITAGNSYTLNQFMKTIKNEWEKDEHTKYADREFGELRKFNPLQEAEDKLEIKRIKPLDADFPM
ncbi:MAG: hypothetical protein HC917_06375 [Richelia sp. SM2_1_7]|nr:hypothetical protein [Richelia sp. SM2_1_7]